MYAGDRPSCPRCGIGMHRHGRYYRYADPAGTERFAVPRFLCPQCGLTISVLPADRLPYRPLSGSRLEAFFNEQAEAGCGLDPPPAVAEAGCLRRAWTRWQTRVATLKEVFGLSIASGSNPAAALWAQLRRAYGTLSDILCGLMRPHQRSLLGDYRCLHLPA